jgi:hypothetical protein
MVFNATFNNISVISWYIFFHLFLSLCFIYVCFEYTNCDLFVLGMFPLSYNDLNYFPTFSRKKFLSLCSIVKTTEWNGMIKTDN